MIIYFVIGVILSLLQLIGFGVYWKQLRKGWIEQHKHSRPHWESEDSGLIGMIITITVIMIIFWPFLTSFYAGLYFSDWNKNEI